MSDDVLWFIDIFQMQLGSLRVAMADKKVRRDKFDKFSYCSWAITETLLIVNDYSGYIDINVIREILTMQLEDYMKYSSDVKESNEKYMYAAEMIEQLLKLIGGYFECSIF